MDVPTSRAVCWEHGEIGNDEQKHIQNPEHNIARKEDADIDFEKLGGSGSGIIVRSWRNFASTRSYAYLNPKLQLEINMYAL